MVTLVILFVTPQLPNLDTRVAITALQTLKSEIQLFHYMNYISRCLLSDTFAKKTYRWNKLTNTIIHVLCG